VLCPNALYPPVDTRSTNCTIQTQYLRAIFTMASLAESAGVRTVNRKLILIGFRGVGKTSLVRRFVDKEFGPEDQYVPTIEQSFKKSVRIENIVFKTEVIDTAGKDEYATFSRQASVGAHGYIFVYSVTSQSSLDQLIKVRENLLNLIGSDTVPIVLVAQKCDLNEREISSAVGVQLAKEWNCPLLNVSAKMNVNIDKVFDTMLRLIEKDSGLLQPGKKPSCKIL
jgi:Ras homolog enriched in brain